MRDVTASLTNALLGDSGISSVFGTRVWGGRGEPPAGYTVGDGPALCVLVSEAPDYDDALFVTSAQCAVWGESEAVAHSAYRTLYDSLHGFVNSDILHAEMANGGRAIEDVTGWFFVLVNYRLLVRGG